MKNVASSPPGREYSPRFRPQPPPRNATTKLQVRYSPTTPPPPPPQPPPPSRPSLRRLNRTRSSSSSSMLRGRSDRLNSSTVDIVRSPTAPPIGTGQINFSYRKEDYDHIDSTTSGAYSPRLEEERQRYRQTTPDRLSAYSPIGQKSILSNRQKSILTSTTTSMYRSSTPAIQTDSQQNTLQRSIMPAGPFDSLRKSFLGASRHSLTSSRITFIQGLGLGNALTSLCALTLASLVFAVLSLMLLFQFGEKTKSTTAVFPNLSDSVVTPTTYKSTLEAGVALTSLSVMLNLCCITAGILQSFFAAKLLKIPQGEERAFRYLKECAGTRMVAIGGFFLSIPCFLIEFHSPSAIVATIVFTMGVAFILITVIHSLYFWRNEKIISATSEKKVNHQDLNGSIPKKIEQPHINRSELSTLV